MFDHFKGALIRAAKYWDNGRRSQHRIETQLFEPGDEAFGILVKNGDALGSSSITSKAACAAPACAGVSAAEKT